MITLFYENNEVNLIYYVEPPKELLENIQYLQVENLPEEEHKDGYRSILKTDGKKLWYEYEITEEKKQSDRIDELEAVLIDLIGGKE